MNFAKEDLLAALVASQNQPKSPYQLQFEAPILPPQQPDREQQFQQDWDTAMQAYQQGMGHLKTNLPPGITYEGKGAIEHTPEEIFNQTIAPLRFQAAEFSPGITSAFGQKALEAYRNAETAHQRVLEKNAEARLRASEIAAKIAEAREQRLGSKPVPFPKESDIQTLNAHPLLRGAYESLYGLGSSTNVLDEATPPTVMPREQISVPFSRSTFTPFPAMPTPGVVTRTKDAGYVPMIDKEGNIWRIPIDKVAEAEKRGAKRQ